MKISSHRDPNVLIFDANKGEAVLLTLLWNGPAIRNRTKA